MRNISASGKATYCMSNLRETRREQGGPTHSTRLPKTKKKIDRKWPGGTTTAHQVQSTCSRRLGRTVLHAKYKLRSPYTTPQLPCYLVTMGPTASLSSTLCVRWGRAQMHELNAGPCPASTCPRCAVPARPSSPSRGRRVSKYSSLYVQRGGGDCR
jgi:hypothetical protein